MEIESPDSQDNVARKRKPREPNYDAPIKVEVSAVAPERTLGLRTFDLFLYPFLTNFAVFGISIVATYLTSRGGMKRPDGSLLYGKLGEWFQKRGDWLIEEFKKTGMNNDQADMSKTVFFSFLDGSLMAPAVKLFEDKREEIAKSIDTAVGTLPPDDTPYEAEPKQSWGSVLAGRFVTSAIVVPTAMMLDKTGLNDTLFKKPGLRFGKWVESKPNLKKYFGTLDIPELGKIGFFEAFYTSVCTAGLYFSSRMFGEHKKIEVMPVRPKTSDTATDKQQQMTAKPIDVSLLQTPEAKIHHASYAQTLEAMPVQLGVKV